MAATDPALCPDCGHIRQEVSPVSCAPARCFATCEAAHRHRREGLSLLTAAAGDESPLPPVLLGIIVSYFDIIVLQYQSLRFESMYSEAGIHFLFPTITYSCVYKGRSKERAIKYLANTTCSCAACILDQDWSILRYNATYKGTNVYLEECSYVEFRDAILASVARARAAK
jgi:hypothetical protein